MGKMTESDVLAAIKDLEQCSKSEVTRRLINYLSANVDDIVDCFDPDTW